MRFLLDENLSPRLGVFLRDAGHDVVHVREIGLTSATDEVVLEAARSERRVLISADTDFGTLLARTASNGPSFVLMRRASGRRAVDQAALIVTNLPAFESDLAAGAIVVLGESTIRIRALPLGRP